MRSLFDDFGAGQMWDQSDFQLEETDDAYVLCIDMPGMKREDIKIDISGNVLTVSGERKSRRHEKGAEESVWGRFNRSFTLPNTIDVEKVEANLEDGVLQLALPFSDQSKPRSVEIQSGKSGFFSKMLGKDKQRNEQITRTQEPH